MILTLDPLEKVFQQVIQVGGSGWEKKSEGEVLIQTIQPNHPVICV